MAGRSLAARRSPDPSCTNPRSVPTNPDAALLFPLRMNIRDGDKHFLFSCVGSRVQVAQGE